MGTTRTVLGQRRRVWLCWFYFLVMTVALLQRAYSIPKKTDLVRVGLTGLSARLFAFSVFMLLLYSVALIGGQKLAEKFDDPESLRLLRWLELPIFGLFVFAVLPWPFWFGTVIVILPTIFVAETRRMNKLYEGSTFLSR
ncbi:MAG TPA: hypothetical protein VN025_03505 [Candidatus Dormibacteraeota bacterium]|nr:hypothetical protein [Candidatus Dormibacteraeota bacterium]